MFKAMPLDLDNGLSVLVEHVAGVFIFVPKIEVSDRLEYTNGTRI